MTKDRDVALTVNLKIGEKQMQLLHALAFLEYESFEAFIWNMIVSGVQAELGGPLSQSDNYDKLTAIIEGKYH